MISVKHGDIIICIFVREDNYSWFYTVSAGGAGGQIGVDLKSKSCRIRHSFLFECTLIIS